MQTRSPPANAKMLFYYILMILLTTSYSATYDIYEYFVWTYTNLSQMQDLSWLTRFLEDFHWAQPRPYVKYG